VFLEKGSELSGGEFRMKVGWDPEEMRGIIGEHVVVGESTLFTNCAESGAGESAESLGRERRRG